LKHQISKGHSVFLVVKLLHNLEVLDWKRLGLSVQKISEYVERRDENAVARRFLGRALERDVLLANRPDKTEY
jgi:hypothetical protein